MPAERLQGPGNISNRGFNYPGGLRLIPHANWNGWYARNFDGYGLGIPYWIDGTIFGHDVLIYQGTLLDC